MHKSKTGLSHIGFNNNILFFSTLSTIFSQIAKKKSAMLF